MKTLRQIGSLAFVVGLFVSVFAGVPWHVLVADDPVVPWWLRAAVFCLLGGILVVLVTVAVEQRLAACKGQPAAEAQEAAAQAKGPSAEAEQPAEASCDGMMVLNADSVPGREITESLGLVQGHTVYAIWLGKDLSALIRLIVGGELTEYTDMMGTARRMALSHMKAQAAALGADAVINVRYMTTSVVGTASELLAYGTAVKLSDG